MGGYAKHDPAVYLVGWRENGVIKAGYTANRRWRKFELRGAELLALRYFEVSADAFAHEQYLENALAQLGSQAFNIKDDQARELLGYDCGGYLECHRVDPSLWSNFVAEHCSRAYARACATQHCHVRTYVTDALRTSSPTSEISPSVTRGRAYGIEVWS